MGKAINDSRHGGGTQGFWNWARSITKGHPTQGNHAEQPMRDPTSGVLHTKPGKINACWARHYRELLRDPHHAACRATIYRGAWKRRRGGRLPSSELNGINGPIAGGEHCKALKRLNDHTTSGWMT
jgi:hypothetical protein